jgi:hypothetical protein
MRRSFSGVLARLCAMPSASIFASADPTTFEADVGSTSRIALTSFAGDCAPGPAGCWPVNKM